MNSGYIPANAIDESHKKNNFRKEFNEFIEGLNIDEQILEAENIKETQLIQLKKMIEFLPLIKDKPEFLECSNKLTLLVKKVISELNKNNCSKTKKIVIDLFNNVDKQLFKTQIELIKTTLK